MATSLTTSWGTANQSITTAWGGLANGSAKASAQLDISAISGGAADLNIAGKIKSGASGTSSTGYVDIWLSGTADDGTTYGDSAAASSAVTLKGNIGPKLIRVSVTANATTYTFSCFCIAALFNGVLPKKIIVVADNHAGSAIDATDGNHGIWYQPVLGNAA